MEYTEAVGKRLKELLRERKFTQTQFAKESNISRTTINRTINGRVSVVTFETLIVFCEALNITLRDFFASELFNEEIGFSEKKKGRRIC